jgi:hypothetical protein
MYIYFSPLLVLISLIHVMPNASVYEYEAIIYIFFLVSFKFSDRM